MRSTYMTLVHGVAGGGDIGATQMTPRQAKSLLSFSKQALINQKIITTQSYITDKKITNVSGSRPPINQYKGILILMSSDGCIVWLEFEAILMGN